MKNQGANPSKEVVEQAPVAVAAEQAPMEVEAKPEVTEQAPVAEAAEQAPMEVEAKVSKKRKAEPTAPQAAEAAPVVAEAAAPAAKKRRFAAPVFVKEGAQRVVAAVKNLSTSSKAGGVAAAASSVGLAVLGAPTAAGVALSGALYGVGVYGAAQISSRVNDALGNSKIMDSIGEMPAVKKAKSAFGAGMQSFRAGFKSVRGRVSSVFSSSSKAEVSAEPVAQDATDAAVAAVATAAQPAPGSAQCRTNAAGDWRHRGNRTNSRSGPKPTTNAGQTAGFDQVFR